MDSISLKYTVISTNNKDCKVNLHKLKNPLRGTTLKGFFYTYIKNSFAAFV